MAEVDQHRMRGIAPIGVDLHVPDLPALARACGAAGVEARDADEVAALASAALQADGSDPAGLLTALSWAD